VVGGSREAHFVARALPVSSRLFSEDIISGHASTEPV
jgi:hypothetical protein